MMPEAYVWSLDLVGGDYPTSDGSGELLLHKNLELNSAQVSALGDALTEQ